MHFTSYWYPDICCYRSQQSVCFFMLLINHTCFSLSMSERLWLNCENVNKNSNMWIIWMQNKCRYFTNLEPNQNCISYCNSPLVINITGRLEIHARTSRHIFQCFEYSACSDTSGVFFCLASTTTGCFPFNSSWENVMWFPAWPSSLYLLFKIHNVSFWMDGKSEKTVESQSENNKPVD